MKFKRNKKGDAMSGFVDAIVLINIAVLIVLFFTLMIFGNRNIKLFVAESRESTNIRAGTILLSYMRTPIGDNSMASLLTEAYVLNNKKSVEIVKEETKDFLNNVNGCVTVGVVKSYPLNALEILMSENSRYCDLTNFAYTLDCAKEELPSFDKSNNIYVMVCVELSKTQKDEIRNTKKSNDNDIQKISAQDKNDELDIVNI